MEQENLTQKIIGCAMLVQQTHGAEIFESMYQNALFIELTRAGLESPCNCRIKVYDRGEQVGNFIADIPVEHIIIPKLIFINEIHIAHEAQLLNYLNATGQEVGLLLNFGGTQLAIKHKSLPVSPLNPVLLSKKSSAFSLMELFVAFSIISILLVILLHIVQGATSLWRTSENKVEAYREARAALQVISSDLKNILPSTNSYFFRTNLTTSPSLGFLATLPISSQNTNSLSDICTIGYFLKYDNKSSVGSNTGRQSYNLYRYFVESNETFENLINNPSAVLDFNPDKKTEILARNVVGLETTYFITNGSGGFTTWTQSTTSPMPHMLEVKLTAVSNERTMRFGARGTSAEWDTFSANKNSTDYLKNTKTFTTRIKLNTP